MTMHDHRVNLLATRAMQLGRSLKLLVHHIAVFAAFIVLFVRWIVEALRWLSLFAHAATYMFDFITRLLHWGRRKGGPGVRELCPTPASQCSKSE